LQQPALPAQAQASAVVPEAGTFPPPPPASHHAGVSGAGVSTLLASASSVPQITVPPVPPAPAYAIPSSAMDIAMLARVRTHMHTFSMRAFIACTSQAYVYRWLHTL
jgi:hypothetical protein